MTFTYKIADCEPVVGGRVLVPFRAERLSGVVTALHDSAPSMQAKAVLQRAGFRAYREMGIYDFYRREGGPEVSNAGAIQRQLEVAHVGCRQRDPQRI